MTSTGDKFGTCVNFVTELSIEGPAADLQLPGGQLHVAAALLQGAADELPLKLEGGLPEGRDRRAGRSRRRRRRGGLPAFPESGRRG